MIQGEVLRVKALKTSVEHREELARLGETRARERHAREVARSSEKLFWREVSRVAKAGGGNTAKTSALDQAREAGRKATLAQERMSASEQALVQQVGRALRLQARCVSLTALKRRERITRLRQREERRGESVQEVFVSRGWGRSPASALKKPLERVRRLDETLSGGVPAAPASLGEPASCAVSLERRDPAQIGPMVSRPLPWGVEVIADQKGKEVRVVSENSGATVQCRVIDQPGAAVRVIVESAVPEIAMPSLASRLALAERLRAAGVSVRQLEFKRESPELGFGGGYLRKRARTVEEGDETSIA